MTRTWELATEPMAWVRLLLLLPPHDSNQLCLLAMRMLKELREALRPQSGAECARIRRPPGQPRVALDRFSTAAPGKTDHQDPSHGRSRVYSDAFRAWCVYSIILWSQTDQLTLILPVEFLVDDGTALIKAVLWGSASSPLGSSLALGDLVHVEGKLNMDVFADSPYVRF